MRAKERKRETETKPTLFWHGFAVRFVDAISTRLLFSPLGLVQPIGSIYDSLYGYHFESKLISDFVVNTSNSYILYHEIKYLF